jgi:hypothetical protein
LVPYLVRIVDAAPEVEADALEAQSVDADRDASSLPLDVPADIPNEFPPYLHPAMADALEAQSVDTNRDATSVPLDAPADIPYPPPPYLILPMVVDEPEKK